MIDPAAPGVPQPTAAAGGPPVQDSAAAADVRAVVKAMRRLDIGNGRLRVRLARELDVSVAELNALAFVRDGGHLTPKQLSRDLHITTGSVTSMIDKLERSGFLQRKPNPADRRSLLLQLTPAGDHAMSWVYDHFHRAVVAAVIRGGIPTELQLTQFLDAAAAALEDLSEHVPDSRSENAL
ncbi:MarR family winged helix-turn-helix transcriptional regulator [Pseudarthrobacter sp. N5]|uniref:MarR family winged helix-turn-helix transcriptional regulator n=1 Tax=Pseudarthrobacter sp. N5 TaxID=3418416 RepID=UPI003CEFFFE0